MSAIQRRLLNKAPGGAQPHAIESLWRATVVEVLNNGFVWVLVPGLAGEDPVGPIPTLPQTVRAGDPVLVGAIEDSRADLMVVATVVPGIAGTAQDFESVTLADAPTLAGHATRKDYVDSEIDGAVTAAVAGANAYTDSQLAATVATLTADVAWTDLTLTAPWVAAPGDGGYFPGLRARVKGGFLELNGAVAGGTAVTVIADLPSGMAPGFNALRPCATVDTLGAVGAASVFIDAPLAELRYTSGVDAPVVLSINERIPMT